MEDIKSKEASTSVPIDKLIARRWSPRAFVVQKAVSREQILALLEAARWAPSCFGEQPWRYLICDRFAEEEAWRNALSCLDEKNQLWAKNAPLLMIAVANERFTKNDKPNRWAQHDTGAASENICLQATSAGLMAHQMGGFDVEKVKKLFAVPEHHMPMAVIAVGYRGDQEHLDDSFVQGEKAERTRKPLSECFFAGRWKKSYP